MTEIYQDIFYKSSDGLKLYARDYAPNSKKPVLLCMHGLTRNSADFHNLALHLSGRFRVVSVDQRGRGRSEYDENKENYHIDTYCADMFRLIEEMKLDQVVAVGTSMGGLMVMLMAATQPHLFRSVILNDIGPEINPEGLDRIKNYVGSAGPFGTWEEAVSALKAQGPGVFPDYTDTDWIDFAKRTCVLSEEGQIRFGYDPALAKPFEADETAAAPVDMWPLFISLFNTPLLIIRGGLSDILSKDTAEKMIIAHPNAKLVEIPRIGHAPMLDEPESLAAIKSFLEPFS